MENIKAIEGIRNLYHEGEISDEVYVKLLLAIGDITGETPSSNYVKVRKCCNHFVELLEDGYIFSVTNARPATPREPSVRVHCTSEGFIALLFTGSHDELAVDWKWQEGDFCEVDFVDSDRDIEYFVLLDEDEVPEFAMLFDIDIKPTHDFNGKELD